MKQLDKKIDTVLTIFFRGVYLGTSVGVLMMTVFKFLILRYSNFSSVDFELIGVTGIGGGIFLLTRYSKEEIKMSTSRSFIGRMMTLLSGFLGVTLIFLITIQFSYPNNFFEIHLLAASLTGIFAAIKW